MLMVDHKFPRWIPLKDVRTLDVIVVRDECVTVSHVSESDAHRRNVSGTVMSKLNIATFGTVVNVPATEMVLLVGRTTSDRSMTPATNMAAVRPPGG